MKINQDYRRALALEFQKRKVKNPRYGIRAFARHLRVAPSTIFEVMKRERHLRPSTAAKVVNCLGWSPAALDGILQEIGRSRKGADRAVFATQESFEKIGDWKAMAVAKLAAMKGCKASPRWVAGRLGMTVSEAEGAIRTLLALGLVEKKRTRLSATTPVGPFIINRRINKAKVYQRSLLKLASDALEIQDEDVALSLIQMVPFDPTKLRKARTLPWRLSEQFRKIGREKAGAQELYCVVVQIFPLTKSKAGEKS